MPQINAGFLGQEAARFRYSDTGLDVTGRLPPVTTLNGKRLSEAKPTDALAGSRLPGSFSLGLGRRDPKPSAPVDRGAFIEIIATGTGRLVRAEVLPADIPVPPEVPWQPLEFLVAVDPSGLVRPPVMMSGSRVQEVDVFFERYLAKTYRLGEILLPGFYRVVVGP